MKRTLSICLAALALWACADKMGISDSPVHSGEIEESYIAIRLSSAEPDTRADDPVYQDGLAAERAVNSAYFFFFQNDEPFPVNVEGGSVNAPGAANGVNYLQATLSNTDPESKEAPNVSDIKNVVLLLKNYKGEYPNQIIAVLNWVPVENKQYTLNDLKQLTGVTSEKGFVMSNAVYMDGANQAVIATPINLSDIHDKAKDAEDNPIKIHVERLAAKVTVTTTAAEGKYNINKEITPAGQSAVPVYAKVIGWKLFNDCDSSYLLKNINPSAWITNDPGFNWNDKNFYRSYWAISPLTDFSKETFTYKGGYKPAIKANVDGGTYVDSTYTYCGENTYRAADDRTKVILKAQLVKNDGTPAEIARWYGTDYLGEDKLRIAVANTLKNTLHYKASLTEYVGIEPDDLMCVAGGGTEVYFQLSTAGETKEWFTYDSTQGHTAKSDDKINEQLESVPSAVVYKNGQTYYYFDIKHLGAEGKDAEFGIVRNHIYSININSIGGYGSPVYDPTSVIVDPEYPEDPEETESFVAAQVRILAWRLVSQGVDIQPQPTPQP